MEERTTILNSVPVFNSTRTEVKTFMSIADHNQILSLLYPTAFIY